MEKGFTSISHDLGSGLVVYPDETAAARAAAKLIADAVRRALDERSVANVVLAGGSTPRRCYGLLGPMLHDPLRCAWWFGDERAVPSNDPASNYRLVAETLLAAAAIPPERVHRIKGELPPAEAAATYAGELASVPANEAGMPAFDTGLLGLGEDGHTASLFPGDPVLDVTDRPCAAVTGPKPPHDRITLTVPALRAIRRAVILATGESKAAAVRAVLRGPDKRYPASLLEATLIVDSAAAP